MAGDAVADLAPLIDEVPDEAIPVAFSTWAIAYLTEQQQRAFVSVLDRVGTERDLSYVYAEHPVEVPGLPLPPRPDGVDDPRFTTLVRLDWRGRPPERHPARRPASARHLGDLGARVTPELSLGQP